MAGATHAAETGALVERLEARRDEIEETLLTRVYAVSDPTEVGDPEYVAGLRAAVSAALDYGMEAIAGRTDSIPPELLAQARRAACDDVLLETVLRRYFAGYTLLGDFVMREIGSAGLAAELDLQSLSRAQAAAFDRLIDAIAAEHRRAADEQARLFRRRRTDCVERLLAGELVDHAELGYDLNAWHLAMVATGSGAEKFIRGLAKVNDRRLLFVKKESGIAWAWLGGRRRIECEEVCRLLPSNESALSITLGEPGKGVGGWRLSHRQAAAAFPIAIRSHQALTRYDDVCLLASIIQDEVLVPSLRQTYLLPLATDRDDGRVLQDTLRTYFRADRNVSATAAALSISRQTVASRIRVVEQRLGRPLSACFREMEAALQLADTPQ